jgi:hypothetical protein
MKTFYEFRKDCELRTESLRNDVCEALEGGHLSWCIEKNCPAYRVYKTVMKQVEEMQSRRCKEV